MAVQLQAPQASLDYFPAVSLRLIEAFAFTARDAREAKGVKQVRIAAALDIDQSTVAYFEQGHWPRKHDLEQTLAAYEDECGVPVAQLLRDALSRYESLSEEDDPLLPLAGDGPAPGVPPPAIEESPGGNGNG